MPQAKANQEPAQAEPAQAQTSAQRQIQRAKELEAERVNLQKRIASNRAYLRLMDSNEELTDDEGTWLDVFYPQKEKGASRSKEDVEATRKLHAEAVKEVTGTAETADEDE